MQSSSNQPVPTCPYVGLQPYTEAEREYFFGREQDTETIAANLLTAPLTLLYGASGVGKTSVLSAGVVPYLRALPDVLVVAFRSWQDETFLTALETEIIRAASNFGTSLVNPEGLPNSPFTTPSSFDEFLSRAAQKTNRTLLIILDQFEEYFLYHPNANPFDEQFARAVNRSDVNTNFILSMREDALSQLDRFEKRIPNLMSNYLRLEHLNRDGAERAIRKPLDVYNTKRANEPPITIEDTLVDTLIDQVRTGRLTLGRAGQGTVGSDLVSPQTADTRDARIETPFLQMVLTRLWEEETRTGSQNLKVETLNRLGGAEKIVRTHLDAVMKRLTPPEQDVCSSFFDRLVTPSGTKVAQNADDLVTYAARPAARVMPILKKLADARVLRPIAPPMDKPQTARYEIFHDVLAPGILDWRGRYTERKRTRRWRMILLGSSFIVLVIAVLAIFAIVASRRATEAEAAAQYLQKEAHAAESRRLALQSAVNREKNFPLALLLGVEAYRSDDNLETQANLFDALISKSQLTTELRGHTDMVWSVAISPNGERMASGSVGASSSIIDKPLILWDLTKQPPTGEPLIARGPGVRAVAFNPVDPYLAEGNVDGTILFWDVVTRQRRGDVLVGHKLQVNSLAFSPDGKILASGSEDGTIIFWDVNNHKPIDPPVTASTRGSVNAIAFSRDGNALASGNADGTILLWDALSHRPIGEPFIGHKDAVLSLVFNGNGRTFASGSKDNTILLWDIGTRQPVGQPFIGHTGGVSSLAFNNNGNILISASQDRIILVWDMNSRKPVFQPATAQKDTVSSIAISLDDKFLVSGSLDSTILLWDTDVDSWIKRACKFANRNLTMDEWKQYVNPDESNYHATCPDLPSPR